MISVQVVADAIKKEFGSFFSTEGHPPADIIKYINSAVRAISNARDWDFNQTKTSITTTIVDQLVAISEPISVYYVLTTDKQPIEVLSFSEYFARPANQALPYAGIWNNNFTVSVPGTYTLIYSAYPSPVTALGDSIAFPDSLQDLVIAYSLAFGFLSVKDDDNARVNFDIAKELLPPIASRQSNFTPNQPTRVGANYSF